MLKALKWWWNELKTAQPAIFSIEPVPKTKYEDTWEQAKQNWAVVVDIRPELDACAAALSVDGEEVATRYDVVYKRAELVAADGRVLAKVKAFHGDTVLNRVFINSTDPELLDMLTKAIAAAHPRVSTRSVPDALWNQL